MFPYHNRLKQLLNSQEYFVVKEKEPFAYRFVFPLINRTIPIREYRIKEYLKYINGKERYD